ncbi:MAG: DNA repair protein RecO [Desulfobacula sp.]|nr:DNA repair protein RecO [Desulfobacula sp.]
MPDFSTDAILLRKIEYGDHDFIISFLTQSKGKISTIAINAKKSIKRFSGALDLFSVNHIQCTLPKKKKDALIILSRADLENGYANIRYDVFKTAYASFWVELIYFWVEEDKKQSLLYDLLLFSLKMLSDGAIDKAVLSLLFQIRFMHISGFSPQIETCAVCCTSLDQINQKKIWFDFQDGRMLCQNCIQNKTKHGMMVSKGTLKQLYWINNTPMERSDRIRFSNIAIREGERLLESFIPFHVGRNFKSLQFLNQLRRQL